MKKRHRRWLHRLGFNHKNHLKGVYFDGHERKDVVRSRQEFVHTLLDLDRMTLVPEGIRTELEENEKPLIRVAHDESTFYANADQSRYWCDGQNQVLKQKSLGAAVMVSDFVDELNGYLAYEGEEARLLLETQKDGYFNNEMFLVQVEKAIDIFEKKYPHARGIFMFDNAPSHRKYPEDGLNVDRMNVGPGGKQAVMRDTTWNGEIQKNDIG